VFIFNEFYPFIDNLKFLCFYYGQFFCSTLFYETSSKQLANTPQRIFMTTVIFKQKSTQWFIFLIILVLAIVSRFTLLDLKPFHHDESLHGFYSHLVKTGRPHEYSALLHGPVLYYLTGGWFWLFGTSNFTARSIAAFFSVLTVLSPFLARRIFSFRYCAILSVFLLSSPTITYFGRFLREDVFMMFWIFSGTFLSLYAWHFKKSVAGYFALAMLALQFCNKENTYLHVFLWLIGFVFIFLYVKKSFHLNIFKHFKSIDVVFCINALLVFCFIYVSFYSSFFQHSKGIAHGVLDGLYRESLLYWWDQNKKRRIDGPFDYHLPLIANYEFILIPILFYSVFKTFTKKWQKYSTLFLLSLFFLPRFNLLPEQCEQVFNCWKNPNQIIQKISKTLHISFSTHILQIISYIFIGGVCFFESLKRGLKFKAFLWFWLTGALGIYSHVGEKVPWLLVYILIPLVMICAFFTDDILSTIKINQYSKFIAGVLVLLFCFTLFKNIRLNFFNPAEISERLVFTQTTPTVHELTKTWGQTLTSDTKELRISLSGDATWPMSWYAIPYKNIDYSEAKKNELHKYSIIFLDESKLSQIDSSYHEFNLYQIPLRHWWVPWQNPTTSQILQYFFSHKPYSKKESADGKENYNLSEIYSNSDLVWGVGSSKVLYLERKFLNGKELKNNEFSSSLLKEPFVQLLKPASVTP
jgi:uncharacterized protein (TIGR03663 family)